MIYFRGKKTNVMFANSVYLGIDSYFVVNRYNMGLPGLQGRFGGSTSKWTEGTPTEFPREKGEFGFSLEPPEWPVKSTTNNMASEI